MEELSELERKYKQIYILSNQNIRGDLRRQLLSLGINQKEIWCPAANPYQDPFSVQHLTCEVVGLDRLDITSVCHPRYQPYSLHYHDFYEFIAVLSGSYYSVIGGSGFSVGKGVFCLIPPGTEHIIGVFDDETLVMNVVFTREFFREEVRQLLPVCRQGDGTAEPDDFKYMLFRTDLPESGKAAADILCDMIRNAANGSVCYLFKSLLRLIIRDERTEITAVRQLSRRTVPNSLEITNFIQSNIRTVTLADVAAYFGYSAEYMKKLIVKKTGVTFRQLTRIIRTELSLFYRMSEQDHMTYSELARLCGWSSVACMKRDLHAMNADIRSVASPLPALSSESRNE